MHPYKKIFCYYAAFSPHIAFAMSVLLYKYMAMDLWNFSFIITLFSIPLLLILYFILLYNPKSESMAVGSVTLLANSCMALIAHIYYLLQKPETDSLYLMITLMLSLMCSGVGLLMMIDNEKIEKLS